MINFYKLLIGACIYLITMPLNAQYKIPNNTFQTGENLTYDIYFKYGLLHKKAGNSTMTIAEEKHKNQDVYKMTMIANSTGLAKKIFTLSDTISCYMNKDLHPLSYTKYAYEGSDFTQEYIDYSYSSDEISIHTKLTRNNVLRYDTIITSDQCLYDMMTIIYYARVLDYSQMKEGEAKDCLFVSGRDKLDLKIKYEGKSKIKANDSNEYN